MRILNELILVGSALATDPLGPCEQCPGKKSLTCKNDDYKIIANGTFKTNCGKKCKNWECAPCDACDDKYEECEPGFGPVLTGTEDCDCGKTANVYGCECVPCSDSGPADQSECGEDEYLMASYVNDSCNPPNICVQTSCNECQQCPIGMPFCGDGYRTVGKDWQTADCDKTCTTYTCVECEGTCPAPLECEENQISETTACEGENCDECNCDVQSCRDCEVCQDSAVECQPWEAQVRTGDIIGECGDVCAEYGCECAAPCSDDVEPPCDPKDKLRSWKEDDECGNTCRRYECVSNDPKVHLSQLIVDMDDAISAMWGDRKPNWQKRLSTAFSELVEQAQNDYDRRNEECQFYGDWSPEDAEEDESADDDARGLPTECQDDAKAMRSILRTFRSWSANYNAPCGENATDEGVVAKRIAARANGLQKRSVNRRCRFLTKS